MYKINNILITGGAGYIGIHGSYTHLSKVNPHLKKALEEFSQNVRISLKIISNPMPKKWVDGKPKIKNIVVSDYNFTTFSNDILKCDIGLVPNITDNSPFFKKTSKTKGLYKNDFFFRFKNKSNSGRMFAFIQHGIPVIADLTPSHLHILGNPENGFAVFNKDGWLNAFKELSNARIRNTISKNGKKPRSVIANSLDAARLRRRRTSVGAKLKLEHGHPAEQIRAEVIRLGTCLLTCQPSCQACPRGRRIPACTAASACPPAPVIASLPVRWTHPVAASMPCGRSKPVNWNSTPPLQATSTPALVVMPALRHARPAFVTTN